MNIRGTGTVRSLFGFLIFGWALVGEAPVPVGAAKPKNDTIFDGQTVLLGVSSGILMEVRKGLGGGQVLASATLPDSTQAKAVTGDSKTVNGTITINTLEIDFSDKPISGSGGSTFSGVRLHLEIRLGPELPGYWSLTALTADYSVDVGEGKKYERKGDAVAVAPRPGYTSSPADVSCQRGYTVCAPRPLSWTCDDQVFLSSALYNNSSSGSEAKPDVFGVAFTFPDLQLQPFFRNGSAANSSKFSYNWDCDPLISSTLWVSLLIPLLLLIFLIWATSMLTSVFAPDKFDNPHGKQIMVPTTD